VPVLVARDVGPVQSIKDSAGLLKSTWGENVVGQVGLGFAFGVIQMAIIIGGLTVIGTAFAFEFQLLAIPMIVLVILGLLAAALFQSALSGIYSAVLYRYAANGDPTIGFDSDELSAAFLPKK
jgi:voltage-gated potassium channel Kch